MMVVEERVGGMRMYWWWPGKIGENQAEERIGGGGVAAGVGCLGLRAGCPGPRARCPGHGSVDELGRYRGNQKISGKNRGIPLMELGEKLVGARSTSKTSNPQIKSNKTSSHQQITKKLGGYFCGDFLKLG